MEQTTERPSRGEAFSMFQGPVATEMSAGFLCRCAPGSLFDRLRSRCDIICQNMRAFRPNKTAPALVIILPLFFNSIAVADAKDVEILERALKKALGDKTTFGTKRVVAVSQESKKGEGTLLIVLNANNNPTRAGLRHGVFTDAVKTLTILKSWDWPGKVERVIIGEHYPAGDRSSKGESRLLSMCLISSSKIREIDWKSFDPNKIPEVMDSVELHDIIK